MNKKSNIMSLSVDAEIQDRLKKVAKKRNVSVSKLVRDTIDKLIGPDEEMVDTVILKIPVELKKDPAELEKWVHTRMLGIVKALTA
jgi:predicted DNA-binding protein